MEIIDYEAHLQAQADQVKASLKEGDNVYVQSEYNIDQGSVVKLNGKSVKIHFPEQGWYRAHTSNIPYHKVAREGDCVVLVWETWKGVNGRGGYRFERIAYPEVRMPVEQIVHQTRITEDEFLQATRDQMMSYLKGAQNRARNMAHLARLLDGLA